MARRSAGSRECRAWPEEQLTAGKENGDVSIFRETMARSSYAILRLQQPNDRRNLPGRRIHPAQEGMIFVLVFIDLCFYIAGSNYYMKRLILSALLLPFAGKDGFNSAHSSDNLVEVRSGQWPINLERNTDRPGTFYSLISPPHQLPKAELMTTQPLSHLAS